jgi:hypothetical protein
MAADIASFSVTGLPERIVTVKSGIALPVLGEYEAVCSWEVVMVSVIEKIADAGNELCIAAKSFAGYRD